MDPDQIKKIIENTIADKTRFYLIYTVISIVISCIIVMVFSYLKTRSENIAVMQTIEKLTQKVEDVKTDYAKQLEIFKGGQQIRNIKIKELYDKTIVIKSLLITLQNDPNSKRTPELYDLTKDLLTSINSDIIFSKVLFNESQLIMDDYNNWVTITKEALSRNEPTFNINWNKTFNTIDTIQEKILNQWKYSSAQHTI